MAKTRSQSRRESSISSQSLSIQTNNKFKKKSKSKAIKNPPEMKKCCIRLTRLDPNQINLLQKNENLLKPNKIESKKYNLRTRSVASPIINKKPKKSIQQIVAMSQSALYTSKAIRVWENTKKNEKTNNVEIFVNQIVCARMSGHRPWPAKVDSFQRNGVSLTFFWDQ